MTVPEENHASIRLRVDQPASGAQAAVDEHGKITIGGILHKHATMVDVSDNDVTSSDFVLGPPPGGVAAWAKSWTTSLRPPHLGANQVCARAVRDPKRSARILRSFTVVDLIPRLRKRGIWRVSLIADSPKTPYLLGECTIAQPAWTISSKPASSAKAASEASNGCRAGRALSCDRRTSDRSRLASPRSRCARRIGASRTGWRSDRRCRGLHVPARRSC
jgi:hypothetical protein